MKMTVLLVPMLACCSTQGGNPEQVHSLPSPSETNVVQANVKNLLDTCDFSKGEWTFYIVEDTNLTRDRYVTSTYGSPALLLEDEKKMEAIRAYHSQFLAHEGNRAVLDLIKTENAYWGAQVGCAYAEPFVKREQIKLDSAEALFGA